MPSGQPFVKREISLDSWTNYIEQNYPDWFENEYKNKWPIKIVYYRDSVPTILTFYFNGWIPISNLKVKFKKLIECQHLCIKNLFGDDIANIIIQYLPQIPDICNNYLYIHMHIPCADNIGYEWGNFHLRPMKDKIYRFRIPEDYTLSNINRALRKYPQSSRYTILRFRDIPLQKIKYLDMNNKL